MAGWYVVQESDCLPSLAQRARLANWRKIYYHPENSALRRARPDPNDIMPGDNLYIPSHEAADDPASMDLRHKYVLKGDPTRLRIVIADEDGQPYSGYRYQLSIGKKQFNGETDDQGLVDHEIDATSDTGELTIWWDLPHPLHCQWNLKIGNLEPLEQVFNPGSVDDNGHPIDRAVIYFQTKYKLPVDGIAGPIMRQN